MDRLETTVKGDAIIEHTADQLYETPKVMMQIQQELLESEGKQKAGVKSIEFIGDQLQELAVKMDDVFKEMPRIMAAEVLPSWRAYTVKDLLEKNFDNDLPELGLANRGALTIDVQNDKKGVTSAGIIEADTNQPLFVRKKTINGSVYEGVDNTLK